MLLPENLETRELVGEPFAAPRDAVQHFKLYFYAAVLHVIGELAHGLGSLEKTIKEFPFLVGYYEELIHHGPTNATWEDFKNWWRASLFAWEEEVAGHLPLQALRELAGIDHEGVVLLVTAGLNEEDARFGSLFEILQGSSGQPRLTMGLLNAWWRDQSGGRRGWGLVKKLLDVGLIQIVNPDAPRSHWALQVPAPVSEAVRGERPGVAPPFMRYSPREELPSGDQLVISDELRKMLIAIPSLFALGQARALLVRGAEHNGRRTFLAALARELNLGMLEMFEPTKVTEERWSLVGCLATLLQALPVIVLKHNPGETTEIPPMKGYQGPICCVLGKQGGVAGTTVERAISVIVEMPTRARRRQLWERYLQLPSDDLETISERFRLTSGNIQRAARLAESYAALEGRAHVTIADAQRAETALNRQMLDTLATHVPAAGDWSQLIASVETLRELKDLEIRCRYREHLCDTISQSLSGQMNAGVRALFTGPSGCGKTLAARLLAASLKMDIYRLDLSSVVNKFIGETEKNLNQIFSRAEELDVILLIDEGDALLTQRTSVQTSNDRYANLETNYLLQRLESFEGIVVVTTNAGDRIDTAFQRRMDVVINFRAPAAPERWLIWQLHLPQSSSVDGGLLEEIAARCTLNGGQIRNAVLHASLLALNDGGLINSAHLTAAVEREYRKTGGVCPLRLG